MLIVYTFIHIQSHIFLCYKILQFDFPDTSIRQTTRAHVQHVFGHDPWKDILLDSRINRYDHFLGEKCNEICEISIDMAFL